MEIILFSILVVFAAYGSYLFFKESQSKSKIIELNQENEKLSVRLEEAKELKLLNNSLLLKNENLEDLNNKLESENLILKKDLDQKTIDVEKTISKYANYSSNLIEQEEKRQSDVLEKKQNEIKDKKMQWRNHENEVQNYIQLICKNNVIDYVGQEDFPHPKNKIK